MRDGGALPVAPRHITHAAAVQEAPWANGCPESRTDLMDNAAPLGTALKCAPRTRVCSQLVTMFYFFGQWYAGVCGCVQTCITFVPQ